MFVTFKFRDAAPLCIALALILVLFLLPEYPAVSNDETAQSVFAENERVLMFSPSFTLFVSDLYSTMARIFSLLFRMGKFPRPPRAVLRQGRDGTMQVGEPRVVYQSKIALVLRRLQNEGMDRSLQRLNMMMQAAPDLADHVDWDACFRLSARVEGAPESMLKPWADVQAMRRRRQALQQAAEQEPAGEEDPYASLDPLLSQLTAIQE